MKITLGILKSPEHESGLENLWRTIEGLDVDFPKNFNFFIFPWKTYMKLLKS